MQQLREDLYILFSDKLQDMLDHFYLKQEAMKIYEAINNHQLYSIQEVIKISEAMNTPYGQRYDKQHKLLIDSCGKKLYVFQ